MKKFLLLLSILTFFFTALSFAPRVVLAGAGPILENCPKGGGQGFNTALGCIPFLTTSGEAQPTGIAEFFLRWGLGVGGGIAFVLMVFAAYQMMTSSGDPHRLQAGKELMTSAISGLIMLILSIYILRLVGIDILNLPGLK